MWSVARYLLIAALVVGPLLAGSYFDGWRWPMIVLLSGFSIVAVTGCRLRNLRSWKIRALLVMVVWLTIQGFWMMWNHKFIFIENEVKDGVHYLLHLEPNTSQQVPSMPGGVDFGEAFDRLSYIVPCLIALFLVAVGIRSGRLRLKPLLLTVFWTGVAVALLGIVQRFSGAKGIYWADMLADPRQKLFFGTYRSPAIACCYLNMCLAVGLSHLLARTRDAIMRNKKAIGSTLLYLLGITFLCAGAVYAGSKAGAVFTLLTLVMFAVWNIREIGWVVKRVTRLFTGGSVWEWVVTIGLMLLMTSLFLVGVAGTVVKRWQDAVDSEYTTWKVRTGTNEVLYKMVGDQDWGAFGFGAGSFYPLFSHYQGMVDGMENENLVYAHNDQLQTLVEWGWLGTACFAAIFFGALGLLVRQSFRVQEIGRSQGIYSKGIAIALLVIFVHAWVDFPFQIESIALVAAVLVGVAWGKASSATR